jgi:hypothetical protein
MEESPKRSLPVIPANAEIQGFRIVIESLVSGACPGLEPGITGVTTFCETIAY